MSDTQATLPAPAAILFDWDNTLIDSWGTIHLALKDTFLAFGMTPWTLQEARERVRESARDAFPKLFGARADEAMTIFYDSFARRHLEGLQSLPGAQACLAALAQLSLPMGVVSNKAGPYLRREVEALAWSDYFGAVVGANDAIRDKPDAEPVRMALRSMEVEPTSAVWFVGDTDVDLLCAANAGCTGVLLRREAPADGEFAGVRVARHLPDFAALLLLVEAACLTRFSGEAMHPA
ncbi:HAD family hydrolase [Aquibaculum arenosum]|uniref:phosphoglycolate phosphatase n=1 Tax=Aquibaculum arenosum TaxID=3032591 RepID=A0ABT5YMY4_9PROT|nr:HAD family hydrolase [Fodinicurvata sp. CAU 1616]MDF2096183.1 HAD family hydrolase [Fodinicurvata sp. CAU 1616]